MAVEVTMPQLSDTMEKGTIVKWHVEEGDHVEMNDILAEVETDKATMDLEAFDEGIVLKKLAAEGEAVPTQALVAVIGEEGEDISELLESDEPPAESEPEQPESEEPEASTESEESEPEAGDDSEQVELDPVGESEKSPEPDPESTAETTRTKTKTSPAKPSGDGSTAQPDSDQQPVLRASPVARRMATRYGLDLSQIEGSGPENRVVKRDVEQHLESGSDRTKVESTPAPGSTETVSVDSKLTDEEQPLSGMRRTIASRMTESKQEVPHFYLERELDVEDLVSLRETLNDERPEDQQLSLNDFLLMAVARSLTQHPKMNASFQGDHIRHYDRVDLGFAVAVEDGLYTPVIREAEQKSLDQIRTESRDLIQRAQSGDLKPEEYKGGTFTVSNLGMFGITNFSAVINPPEAGILAVGTVREQPVAEDGSLTVGKRMGVTLSGDHRVIDGAIGARYIQTLTRYLEQPVRLFA